MSGISKQVGRYKAAARTRNMGSQPSAQQVRAAQQTALGGRNRSGGPKGSWAGYQSGHSTYIQPNGAGYDSLRGARYRRSGPVDFRGSGNDRNINPISRVGAISQNVFDYTYSGSGNNSISMMNRQRRLDQRIRNTY